MRAGNVEVRDCNFDPDPKPKARFKCEIVDEESDSAELVPHYDCIKTPNTGQIESLAQVIVVINCNWIIVLSFFDADA